jgi:alpha-glucosidase
VTRPGDTDWWRSAVVYQVYPRSFADHDGDGTGDILGIIDRLPYLARLGIDAIWVSPWYPSPMVDGGYDVSDYRGIHPDFGTVGLTGFGSTSPTRWLKHPACLTWTWTRRLESCM